MYHGLGDFITYDSNETFRSVMTDNATLSCKGPPRFSSPTYEPSRNRASPIFGIEPVFELPIPND